MKILIEIYNQILACPKVPPESGGILGTSDRKNIDYVVFDRGLSKENGGIYIPNIDFLNRTIEKWSMMGIEFCGIFHTHVSQLSMLSNKDKEYIIDIINAMPSNVRLLYFPLVFPGKNMKGYIAERRGGAVNIIDDDIEIVKEEERQNERNK